MQTVSKVPLLSDTKFRWLVLSLIVVAIFEFLSLAGWELPDRVAAPFFLAVILLIGYRTIWHGLRALARLNFKSINLLMVIALAGAFYIGGLVTSTILALVALPALYELSEGLDERVNRRWSEWRAGGNAAAPVSAGD